MVQETKGSGGFQEFSTRKSHAVAGVFRVVFEHFSMDFTQEQAFMDMTSREHTFANRSLTYTDKTVDRSAAGVLFGVGFVGVKIIRLV